MQFTQECFQEQYFVTSGNGQWLGLVYPMLNHTWRIDIWILSGQLPELFTSINLGAMERVHSIAFNGRFLITSMPHLSARLGWEVWDVFLRQAVHDLQSDKCGTAALFFPSDNRLVTWTGTDYHIWKLEL